MKFLTEEEGLQTTEEVWLVVLVFFQLRAESEAVEHLLYRMWEMLPFSVCCDICEAPSSISSLLKM